MGRIERPLSDDGSLGLVVLSLPDELLVVGHEHRVLDLLVGGFDLVQPLLRHRERGRGLVPHGPQAPLQLDLIVLEHFLLQLARLVPGAGGGGLALVRCHASFRDLSIGLGSRANTAGLALGA